MDWKSDATHTPDTLDINSILYVRGWLGEGGINTTLPSNCQVPNSF